MCPLILASSLAERVWGKTDRVISYFNPFGILIDFYVYYVGENVICAMTRNRKTQNIINVKIRL